VFALVDVLGVHEVHSLRSLRASACFSDTPLPLLHTEPQPLHINNTTALGIEEIVYRDSSQAPMSSPCSTLSLSHLPVWVTKIQYSLYLRHEDTALAELTAV
jgi:hypothetical protein